MNRTTMVETSTGQQACLGWLDELQTFAAFVESDRPGVTGVWVGRRSAEFATAYAVVAECGARGMAIRARFAPAVDRLQTAIDETVGVFEFGGATNRRSGQQAMVMVTPSGAPIDVVASSQRAGWGGHNERSATAAAAMLERCCGPSAHGSDTGLGDLFCNEVLAALPPKWSMKATDIAKWYTAGDAPEVRRDGVAVRHALNLAEQSRSRPAVTRPVLGRSL